MLEMNLVLEFRFLRKSQKILKFQFKLYPIFLTLQTTNWIIYTTLQRFLLGAK